MTQEDFLDQSGVRKSQLTGVKTLVVLGGSSPTQSTLFGHELLSLEVVRSSKDVFLLFGGVEMHV